MKSNTYTIVSLFVASALALHGCGSSEAKDDKPKEIAPVIETFQVKRQTIQSQLLIPGELTANQQVDLYAKVTGFVKQLNVDIGSEVKEGQILLILEAPEIVAQLAASESRLKSQQAVYLASQASYNRLVETSKTPGTISQNDLEIAEAKKNSDLANLDAAKASFREVNDIRNYLVMRAPFSGTITARNVNTGAYVGPNGKGSELPALTLQQNKKLRLVISIPEAYAGFVNAGDTVSFKVRSNPAHVYSGRVSRMAGALDSKLRSQRVELDVDNKDGKLLAGTVAEVTIPLSTEGFVVPASALVNSSEALFVVKSENHQVVRIPVKKGMEANQRVQVFGNLTEGDTLIVKANDEMKNGAPLKDSLVNK